MSKPERFGPWQPIWIDTLIYQEAGMFYSQYQHSLFSIFFVFVTTSNHSSTTLIKIVDTIYTMLIENLTGI